MPPPSMSSLWGRSKGLATVQRLMRMSSAQAGVLTAKNPEEADLRPRSHGWSQDAAGPHRLVHPASGSSHSSDTTPSQKPLLDIARSLEHRLRVLQQEHVESQIVHTSSHASHRQAVDALHGDEGTTAQQQMEAQWARYHQHRSAAGDYIAQRSAKLHEASEDSSLSSGSDIFREGADDTEDDIGGKMQRLRKLLDAPLLSESGSTGFQEADASAIEGTRQADSALSRPDAASGRTQVGPSISQHEKMASPAAWAVMQGGSQADVVPIHSQKLLRAGIIGVPNSGKSTLTNSLAGKKVTAVSDKTNTTGAARLGAFTEGDSQVALYDTPGVVHTRCLHGPRHTRSVRSAWGTASQCDMLMCIVDAHRQMMKPDSRVYGLVEELASGPLPDWKPLPTVLVLNKVDLLAKDQGPPLLQLRDRFLQLFPFQGVFCVSARHGAGVLELKQYLLDRCQPGRWTVNSWEATDMGPSEIATELVRERLFKRLYKEVPYKLDIRDVSVRYLGDGSIRIEKDIMVSCEQIRKIVVGSKGAVVGEVGIAARRTLETVLAKTVHLMLNVRVSSN